MRKYQNTETEKTYKDHMYVSEIKHLVSSFLSNISNMNAQLKWELLKYEVCEFTIDYTKRKAKESRKQQALLESELESLRIIWKVVKI